MSTQANTTIPVYLMQSPKTDRYYFTAQSFESEEIIGYSGNAFQALTPRGTNLLPDDAVKSKILPIEWNDWTRAEVVAEVGAIADMDYVTGGLLLRPKPKK
mgnify:CR=1 FL=1